MGEYITRDSGARQDFDTGSRRDTQDGKPRYDLIALPALRRWAELMTRGAEKYGERNWELGQPLTRYEESALRHLFAYLEGDRVEDHLAAALFNVGGIMHHEEAIAAGRLPAELDDRPAVRRLSVATPEPAPEALRAGTRVLVSTYPLSGETYADEPGTIARVDHENEWLPYYVALDSPAFGRGHVWAGPGEVRPA